MGKFIDLLKSFDDFFAAKGAEDSAIACAEEKLGLKFSDEYKEYLRAYGVASADGHEFTGFIESKRLNVVDVTESKKAKNPNVPNELYVVEDLQTDELLIWQAGDGKVYKTVFDGSAELINNSLFEYLKESTDSEE